MTARRPEMVPPSAEVGERDAVVIACRDSLDVMTPVQSFCASAQKAVEALDCIADATSEAPRVYREVTREEPGRKPPPFGDADEYFARLGELAKSIKVLVEGGGGVVVQDVFGANPKRTIRALFKAFRASKVKPDGLLVRILVASLSGDLGALAVRVHGEHVQVVANWHSRSFDTPLVVIDPSLDVATLSKAIGQPVRDASTSRGAQPVRNDSGVHSELDSWKLIAAQAFLGRDDLSHVADHITGKTRPGRIAAIIRGRLWDVPEGVLGVILTDADSCRPEDVGKSLHQRVGEQFTEAELSRIKLTDWNEPSALSDCAATLVLGTPPTFRRGSPKDSHSRATRTPPPKTPGGGPWIGTPKCPGAGRGGSSATGTGIRSGGRPTTPSRSGGWRGSSSASPEGGRSGFTRPKIWVCAWMIGMGRSTRWMPRFSTCFTGRWGCERINDRAVQILVQE